MSQTSSQRRLSKVLNEENGVIDVDNSTQEEAPTEKPEMGIEDGIEDMPQEPEFDVDMAEFDDDIEMGNEEIIPAIDGAGDLHGQLTTLQGCIDDVYAALKKSGNPHSEEAAIIRSKVFDLIGAVKSSN